MPLTASDRKRLHALNDELQEKIADGTATEDYRDTLAFMLENDCKLEQEVVGVSQGLVKQSEAYHVLEY